MKPNISILIIFTISFLVLFGCDQIVDRSLGKINKTRNNELTSSKKERSQKSLDSSSKDNAVSKSDEKENLAKEELSPNNRKTLKKKIDVIGTNKDGPYRSGETNRIRSAK